MSRSRRRPNPGKCICGLRLVPFLESVGHRVLNPGCPHPLAENVAIENERFRRYKERKAAPSEVTS